MPFLHVTSRLFFILRPSSPDVETLILFFNAIPSSAVDIKQFSITTSDNNKESLNWEPGTEKILIILSKDNFEKYKSINNNPMFKSVLATLIVLPVITEIICKYEEFEDEYEDSRWFRVLEKQLTKAGVNIENINCLNVNPKYIFSV